MKILYYGPETSEGKESLTALLPLLAANKNSEFLHHPNQLRQRTRHPQGCPDLAVLVAATKIDLRELLANHEFFYDSRVVLVLPDSDKQTVLEGHALRPRYLTHVNGDPFELKAVVAKMILTLEKQYQSLCDQHSPVINPAAGHSCSDRPALFSRPEIEEKTKEWWWFSPK
jgi:hypothetical protein